MRDSAGVRKTKRECAARAAFALTNPARVRSDGSLLVFPVPPICLIMKLNKRLPARSSLALLLELVPRFESVERSNAVGVALREAIGASIAVELGEDGALAAQAEAINNVIHVLHAQRPPR